VPSLPEGQGEWFTELRQKVELYAARSLTELTVTFDTLDERVQEAEALVKSLKQEIEAVTRAILRKMEATNLDSMSQNGRRWTVSHEIYPQVKDKVALREWCEKNGMIDTLIVPHQTLKATVKGALESGDSMPDGVELYLKPGLRRSKQN
jgi:hypothetical protein